jgi:pyruvate/2-oxoglutarate dehydrogenase complex dihydrolipoamide acyltransferase (E2) component
MSKELNTNWRKVSAAIYKKPVDSKIFGSVEVDVTDLEIYVAKMRKQGIKLTLTHVFTSIIANALKSDVPELNCFVRRGNIIQREQVDAMVSVLVHDSEMSSVRIQNADKLNLNQLVEKLSEGIAKLRSGDEDKTMQMKGVIARIPWPFRGWIFNFIKRLTVSWGISIPAIGLTANNFGSFVITNIGSIGLDTGFPALFPISNVAMVFVMGGVFKKPLVVNDKIEIRRVISLSCALDHRLVDAIHGGRLFKIIKDRVRNIKDFENEMIRDLKD